MQGMKRIIFLLLALLFCSGFFITEVRADEGWVIDSFHSEIKIQENGIVDITEKISVDFSGLQKHGIYRDIPYVYQESTGNKTYTDVEIVDVSADNVFAEQKVTRNNSNIQIKIGDPDTTISGKHTYLIHYKVAGVLRNIGETDELYWNVTGNDWNVPITNATATVALPSGQIVQVACYQGEIGSSQSCEGRSNGQTANFEFANLSALQGMTVAVSYPKDLVPRITVGPPPTLIEQIRLIPLIGTFLIIVLGGATLLLRNWLHGGRDSWFGHQANAEGAERAVPFGTKEAIAPEFLVPGHLRPAELGVLVDERADTLDVTATIVDLAARGYITITEVEKKWAWGSKDYILKRKKDEVSGLHQYEKIVLRGLFAEGNEVTLSSLKNKFYDDLSKAKDALYDEVVTKKLFVQNPGKIRNRYYGWGFLWLAIGLPQLIIGIVMMNDIRITPLVWPLLGGGAGLVVVAIICWVVAFAMPARTAKGRDLYRRALGYKLFISKVEKFRAQFLEKEGMFETVLPYAIVFGVTKELAHAMKSLEIQPPQPSWYIGTHPFSPSVFANDIDTLSSTLSTAIASSPSSSGSGGGGFSGGGFGGGGGGSW